VQLFITAAQRAHSNFQLEPQHEKAAAEICRVLQGNPLGILLAASWLNVMEVSQIAAEIRQNLDFLSSDWQDLPERQRSLRATFAYSFGLLQPGLQVCLLRLSIFRAMFTPQRAQQVTHTSLNQLKKLVDHSFLIYNRDGSYQIHGTLRQYAMEALVNATDLLNSTRASYCQVFMEALAEWSPQLQQSEQLNALSEMDRELQDIHAAWVCAMEQKQLQLIERGADGLGRYYFLRALYNEGLVSFSKIIASFQEGKLALENPLLWARALNWQSAFLFIKSRYPEAMQASLEADRFFRHQEEVDPESKRVWATTLQMMGQAIPRIGGDRHQALAYIEQSLAWLREIGSPWEISQALLRAAVCHYQLGNFRRKLQYAEEAMTIQKKVGDPELTASIDITLGFAYMLTGQFDKALQSVDRQNASLLQVNTRRNQADAHGQLGFTLMYAGRYREARRHIDQALPLYLMPDEMLYIDFYVLIRAHIDLYSGRYQAVQDGIQESGHVSVDFVKPQWMLLQGYLHLLNFQYDQAEKALEIYIAHYASLPRQDMVGYAVAIRACCAYWQGEHNRARSDLIAALDNFLAQGFIMVFIVSMYLVALILAETGGLEDAVQLYRGLQSFSEEQNVLFEDLFGKHIQAQIAALPHEAVTTDGDQIRITDLDATARFYLEKLESSENLIAALAGKSGDSFLKPPFIWKN
jgi:tetratricopeptide (TPR) repeat protein